MAEPRRSDADETPEGEPAGPRLQGDILSATLLALLKQYDAYGYQLTAKMEEAGLPAFDPSAIYRHLRQLEAAGLVSSMWDTSSSGPARRVYSLTRTGELFLGAWAEGMKALQAVINQAMTPVTPEDDTSPEGREDD
jgi:PadR family transcriptional regulator, regulatory protein PadR